MVTTNHVSLPTWPGGTSMASNVIGCGSGSSRTDHDHSIQVDVDPMWLPLNYLCLFLRLLSHWDDCWWRTKWVSTAKATSQLTAAELSVSNQELRHARLLPFDIQHTYIRLVCIQQWFQVAQEELYCSITLSPSVSPLSLSPPASHFLSIFLLFVLPSYIFSFLSHYILSIN